MAANKSGAKAVGNDKPDKPSKKPRKRDPGSGRPTIYTPELGDRICERLADGETLIAICRDDDMPDERTCRMWALNPQHDFSPKYSEARIIGYHRMADQLADVASQQRYEKGMVARDRLHVDTMKWLVSKALPKIYGDKVAVTDPNGEPITVNIVKYGG